MRRHSGFIPIELLVAIAIFLILAAIALPVLVRAVAQAREVKCLSNLRYHQSERGACAFCDGQGCMMTFGQTHEKTLHLWKVEQKTDPPTPST